MTALSASYTLCVTSNPGRVSDKYSEHRDPDFNVTAVHRNEDEPLTIQNTHQMFSLVSLPLRTRTTNVCFQHHNSKSGSIDRVYIPELPNVGAPASYQTSSCSAALSQLKQAQARREGSGKSPFLHLSKTPQQGFPGCRLSGNARHS